MPVSKNRRDALLFKALERRSGDDRLTESTEIDLQAGGQDVTVEHLETIPFFYGSEVLEP